MFIIAVYVDDILLAGKSDKRIAEVKEALSKQFEVKDIGQTELFFGYKHCSESENRRSLDWPTNIC